MKKELAAYVIVWMREWYEESTVEGKETRQVNSTL
jgi:hypothetical protein